MYMCMSTVVRGMCDGITFVDKLTSNVLYKGTIAIAIYLVAFLALSLNVVFYI